MRRTVKAGLIALLPALAGCASASAPVKPPEPRRPNIVLVLTDQWRGQDLGYAGNNQVRTPNIDRLAAESVVFANAIANTPVCAPTRAALMTGQYATQNGVFYNDRPLPNSAVTIAETLKAAGYRTGYIGKWHLNGFPPGEFGLEARDTPVPRDRRQGFNFWRVHEATHDYNHSVYYDEENRRHVWPGYDADAQTREAERYIAANKGAPFFLTLSYGPPHDPYETAPPRERALYEDAEIALRPNVPASAADEARKTLRGYYAHIAALDRNIGALMAFIDRQGLTEDTIFVFTSDHGDMIYSHDELLKQKPWDESIKVPFVIRYPAAIKAHRTVTTPFSSPDVMPTLLGLSGVAAPETVTGLDFSREVRGTGRVETPGALLLLPTPFGNWSFAKGGRAFRGIRTERYTYVADRNGPWLLYDNLSDPYQQRNLIGDPAQADLRAGLQRDLDRLLASVGDRFLAPQCYMEMWGYEWGPGEAPTNPADARCPAVPERPRPGG